MDSEHEERARARAGTTLKEKYRVEKLLGVGGMAAVYAATHRNGRRVAVKMLHPELAARSDIRQRFIREGHAANAVDHPGVVAVIDDDITEDGAPFLVMELLGGLSVEEMWERNGYKLATRTVLAIGRDLCAVLAVAHEKGVIHRDIKPANLFVTDDGRLKVLDFGIASVRDLASSARLTSTGAIVGTPAFLSPEQASGRVSQVDHRADVWAVGATMFTLLSGHLVHEGESAQHLALLAATQPPRSLATVAPKVDAEVCRIVDRALRLDKSERWQSAQEMHQAIVDVSERAWMGDEVSYPQHKVLPGAGVRLAIGGTTAEPVSVSAPTRRSDAADLTPPGDTGGDAALASDVAKLRIITGNRGSEPPSSVAATVSAPPLAGPTPTSGRPGLYTPDIPPTIASIPQLDSSAGRSDATFESGPSKRRFSVVIGLGALVAVAAVGAVGMATMRGSARNDPTAHPSAATSLRTSPTTSLGASTTAVATTEPPAGATSPPPSAISPPPSAPPKATPPVATPPAPRKPGTAKTTPTAAPPPSAHPDCSTKYVTDSTGKVTWKPECL